MKFILRDVALKAIETMPDLARELMEPAKAITEIDLGRARPGASGLAGVSAATSRPAPSKRG